MRILILTLFPILVMAQNPNVPLSQNALGTVAYIPNSGSTGTTLNKLASLTGAPSKVVITTAGATGGVVGIVASGAGTTGTATIQVTGGSVPCVFDGSTTAGDYVQISASVNGDCADAGSTLPSSGQVLGRVLTTNSGAGTYKIDLNSSGGGSGSGGTVACAGTDDTVAIQAAMDATGGVVSLSAETCVVSNLVVTKNVSFIGLGPSSILSMKSGATGFMLDGTGFTVRISNMVLDGGLNSSQQGTSSAGTRSGVQFDVAAYNNLLNASIVRGFSNLGTAFKGLISLRDGAPIVTSSFFYYNFTGLQNRVGGSGTAGEYVKVIGNDFSQNRNGIIDYAGNTNIVGNTIVDNANGVLVSADTNNGHGSLVGNSINHQTLASINITGITNGFQVVGNNIWSSSISIDSSIGVNFSNNTLGSVSDISLSSAGSDTIGADQNCRFTGNTVQGATPTLSKGQNGCVWQDNLLSDGTPWLGFASFQATPNPTPTTTGSNLITNGGFTSGANWTTSSGASISGNAAHLVTGLVFQDIGAATLGTYAITFTVSGSGTFQFGLGGAQTSQTYSLTAGTYTKYLQVTKANDTNFYLIGITNGTAITTLSALLTLPSATSLSSLQFGGLNGLIFSSGSNTRTGTGTLSSGTLAVGNTSITANSKVFVQDTGGGTVGNIGTLYVASTTAGTGFTVTSTNALDNSTFSYVIYEAR